MCWVMIGKRDFRLLLLGTCFKIQSRLSRSVNPNVHFSLSSQDVPSLRPRLNFGAPGKKDSSISTILPYPPNFGVCSGFHIQEVHTFLQSAYISPIVWSVFVPTLQKSLHWTMLNLWTKFQIILNWSCISYLEWSKNVPFLTENLWLLHFIPLTLLVQIQYHTFPCFIFRIMPPQFTHCCETLSSPKSVRYWSKPISLSYDTSCVKSAYDICSVTRSCLYIARNGCTFCRYNLSGNAFLS